LPDGSRRLKRLILDELEAAIARGDFARAAELRATIRRFCDTHPENNAVKTG
jgi:protein-arginine kinase activator protein McsA